MMHDQIAAAGFRTELQTDLAVDRLVAAVGREAPDVVVLGATDGGDPAAIRRAV
jgi:hypothetical protein